MCIWAIVVAIACVEIGAPNGRASQKKQMTPSETVVAFYKFLREQKYSEGFALSVYREAIEGLSDNDLSELLPEFHETFADIPEKVVIEGEQANGDDAIVLARFSDDDDIQEIALIREGGKWIVGDRDALDQVRRETTAFFFNTRIRVNENETFKLLKQIMGSQSVYFQKNKAYATIDELQKKEGLAGGDGGTYGYRIQVNLTPDRQGYTVIAYPVRYRRTGTVSFFSDGRTIHGADAKGLPVNEQAPVLVPDAFETPQMP